MRFSKRNRKKKLSEMTILDAQRESKLRAEEEAEKIDVQGQENEKKAVKWVQEEYKEYEKEQKEEEIRVEERLTEARKRVVTYKEALVKELHRQIQKWGSEVPKGYKMAGGVTTKGIVLYILDKERNWYAKGIKISALPRYDLAGISTLVLQGLAYIDGIENSIKKTPGGIILP